MLPVLCLPSETFFVYVPPSRSCLFKTAAFKPQQKLSDMNSHHLAQKASTRCIVCVNQTSHRVSSLRPWSQAQLCHSPRISWSDFKQVMLSKMLWLETLPASSVSPLGLPYTSNSSFLSYLWPHIWFTWLNHYRVFCHCCLFCSVWGLPAAAALSASGILCWHGMARKCAFLASRLSTNVHGRALKSQNSPPRPNVTTSM